MNGPPKEKPPRGGKGLNSTESGERSQSRGDTSSCIVTGFSTC